MTSLLPAWEAMCPERGSCGPQCQCADIALEFAAFVESLQLRHFTARELLVGAARPRNSAPPRRLWTEIAPAALVLDRARAELGVPVRITSAYRTPIYNRHVGGVARSQHVAFRALDSQPVGDEGVRDLAEILRSLRGREIESPVALAPSVAVDGVPHRPLERTGRGFIFRGGIGVYRTFVHVDTRGVDANWTG